MPTLPGCASLRRLQREHLPLAEIRQRLAGLDDAAIASLADQPAELTDPQDSALDYIRRVLGPPPASLMRWPGIGERPAASYALAAEPTQPQPIAPARAPITLGVEPAPGRNFERSQWERIPLAPDIELHVRRPLPRPLSKQVDRLVSIARDLLEEDPS